MSELITQPILTESEKLLNKYLIDQNGSLVKELVVGQRNWYQAKVGQFLRLENSLNSGQLVDDLLAARVGADLVITFADGTTLVGLNYFNCGVAKSDQGAAMSVCHLTVAADDTAGYTIPRGAGHSNDQAQIIYHHGKQSALEWAFTNQSEYQDNYALAQALELEVEAEPALGPLTMPFWAPIAGGLAALGVASAGGGEPGLELEPEPEPLVVQNYALLTGQINAGPVTPGHGLLINAFDPQGKVLDTVAVNDQGEFNFNLDASYRGLVLLQVIDVNTAHDYINEANAKSMDLTGDLRTIINIDGGGAYTAQINPLTEMAVVSLTLSAGDKGSSQTLLGSINLGQVTQAMSKIAHAFGLLGLNTAPKLTIDADKNATLDSNSYGKALALLSAMELDEQLSTEQLLKKLSDEIAASSDHEMSLASRYQMIALARNMGLDSEAQAEAFKLPNAQHIETAWASLEAVVKAEPSATITATQLATMGVHNAQAATTINLVNDLLAKYADNPTNMNSVDEVQQLINDTNTLHSSVNGGPPPSLDVLHKLGLTQVNEDTLAVVQNAFVSLSAITGKLAIDTWVELDNLVTQEVGEYKAALTAMRNFDGSGELSDVQFSDLGLDLSGVVPDGTTQDDHLSYIESSLAQLNLISQGAQLTQQSIEAAIISYGKFFLQLSTASNVLTVQDFVNVGIIDVNSSLQVRDAALDIKGVAYASIDTFLELNIIVNQSINFDNESIIVV